VSIGWQQSATTTAGPAAGGIERATRSDALFTTWVTSVNGIDHAVTDENVAAGINALDGRFPAVCAEIVMAAFLVMPPGSQCPRCREVVAHSGRRSRASHLFETPPPASTIVLRPVVGWLRTLFSARPTTG
jgi:hypothetical protein